MPNSEDKVDFNYENYAQFHKFRRKSTIQFGVGFVLLSLALFIFSYFILVLGSPQWIICFPIGLAGVAFIAYGFILAKKSLSFLPNYNSLDKANDYRENDDRERPKSVSALETRLEETRRREKKKNESYIILLMFGLAFIIIPIVILAWGARVTPSFNPFIDWALSTAVGLLVLYLVTGLMWGFGSKVKYRHKRKDTP